jgi:ribonuclease D
MFPPARTGIIAHDRKATGRTVTTTQTIGWVATADKLAQLLDALANESIAAVDTEFVREKTYYPQLCLIQVATHEHAACIDCLAPLDLEPLYALLFRAGFTWVCTARARISR